MKKYLFILIAFATLIFTGCEKRNDKPAVGPSGVSIEFTAEVAAAGSATPSGVASRASASKTVFIEGDKIGVFVVPNSSGDVDGTVFSSDNYVDNEVFTASSTLEFTATGSKTVTFPTADTKVAIYAFAMYNVRYNTLGTNPKAVIWTVPASQTTAAVIIENDVMTAQALDVAPGTKPSLSFAHRLAIAQVEVTPPVGNTYRGKAITSITAKLRNVDPKATINMTDNSVVVVASTRAAASLVDIDMNKLTKVGAVEMFEAILPPQTYAGGDISATLTITTSEGSFGFDLEIPSGATNFKFEAGKRTKIPVTFDDEFVLSFGAVSITDWENVTLATIDTRRPAIMTFTIENKGIKAAEIVSASLLIDGKMYDSKASFDDASDKLSCVYMYDANIFGDKLERVILYNKSSSSIGMFTFDPSVNIPGDPTEEGYDKVIETLTLD